MSENIINLFAQMPGFYDQYLAFILIFSRVLAFIYISPMFKRKEVVAMIKIGLALILSYTILFSTDHGNFPKDVPYLYLLVINIVEGLFFGHICQMIYDMVQAAGDLANTQMSLSSASMFDPSTRQQSSIMGQVYSLLGLVIFFNIGGVHMLISALIKTFDIFPVFYPTPDFAKAVTMDYWIYISGNVTFIAFQIIAPILITTLAVDIILGIISKIAPQVNVFQLSFVFKPVIGCIIFLITLPLLMRVLEDYFISHSNFF